MLRSRVAIDRPSGLGLPVLHTLTASRSGGQIRYLQLMRPVARLSPLRQSWESYTSVPYRHSVLRRLLLFVYLIL